MCADNAQLSFDSYNNNNKKTKTTTGMKWCMPPWMPPHESGIRYN